MTRRATWQRLAISAFLMAHLGAVLIWNLPRCAIRDRLSPTVANYLLPLGLWQYWGMFAPDPPRHGLRLEAVVTDRRGLAQNFAFPKISDYGPLAAMPRVRHAKFSSLTGEEQADAQRTVAARHAVRQLNIAEENFPVHVELHYAIQEVPAPGGPEPDPFHPPKPVTIGTVQFASGKDVRS